MFKKFNVLIRSPPIQGRFDDKLSHSGTVQALPAWQNFLAEFPGRISWQNFLAETAPTASALILGFL